MELKNCWVVDWLYLQRASPCGKYWDGGPMPCSFLYFLQPVCLIPKTALLTSFSKSSYDVAISFQKSFTFVLLVCTGWLI